MLTLYSSQVLISTGMHLGPDDLLEVLQEVWDASNKWFNIGLQLKLTPDALKNIKQQYSDQHDALREMLSLWLDGMGSLPTWATLAGALESRIVGVNLLAAELRTKHSSSPHVPDTPSLSRTSSEPSGTSSEPSGTNSKSSGTSSKPSGTSSKPSGTSSEPSGTSSKSSGTSSKPSGTNSKPSGTSSEPIGTSSEPSETSSEPSGTSSEHSGTSSEPSGTSSEPIGTSSEPDFFCSVKSGDKDHDPAHLHSQEPLRRPEHSIARMSGIPYIDAENLKEWEKDSLKGRLNEECRQMICSNISTLWED